MPDDTRGMPSIDVDTDANEDQTSRGTSQHGHIKGQKKHKNHPHSTGCGKKVKQLFSGSS